MLAVWEVLLIQLVSGAAYTIRGTREKISPENITSTQRIFTITAAREAKVRSCPLPFLSEKITTSSLLLIYLPSSTHPDLLPMKMFQTPPIHIRGHFLPCLVFILRLQMILGAYIAGDYSIETLDIVPSQDPRPRKLHEFDGKCTTDRFHMTSHACHERSYPIQHGKRSRAYPRSPSL